MSLPAQPRERRSPTDQDRGPRLPVRCRCCLLADLALRRKHPGPARLPVPAALPTTLLEVCTYVTFLDRPRNLMRRAAMACPRLRADISRPRGRPIPGATPIS